MRGFFEIGIYNGKTPVNLGTLWRSAYQLGAAGIFTVAHRYHPQSSDTVKAFRHIPLRQFLNFEDFQESRPRGARLVGVEMGGKPLSKFHHPEQAIYLLGAEDNGLPGEIQDVCQNIISIESLRIESYNVAVAGSIVMYHRLAQSLNA